MGLAMTFYYICAIMMIALTQTIFTDLTAPGAFFMFFGFNLFGALFVFFCMKDTRGLSFEECQRLYSPKNDEKTQNQTTLK